LLKRRVPDHNRYENSQKWIDAGFDGFRDTKPRAINLTFDFDKMQDEGNEGLRRVQEADTKKEK
jgi:hypothetical protein